MWTWIKRAAKAWWDAMDGPARGALQDIGYTDFEIDLMIPPKRRDGDA
jgi:hypothetical protein